jgi:hypothetical protein
LAFGLAAACEDKQCKTDLQSCAAKGEQMQKELDAAKAENAALKSKTAKVDEIIAKLAAATAENEKLKAAPPAPAPPPKTSKH